MINTIIFDVGEVIFKGFRDIVHQINKDYDLNASDKHFIVDELELLFHGKITEKEYWERIIEMNKWAITVNALMTATRNNFIEIEGTLDIIKRLHANGYKIGILSIHVKEWVDFIEKKFGYHKYFDALSYSYESGVSKPNPKSFEDILTKLAVEATSCIFVDDKEENILAAKKIGMRTILFKNHVELRRELLGLHIKL